MQTHLDEESLVRANAQFWEQMLGMKMETVPSAEDFCVGAGHVLVSVNLSPPRFWIRTDVAVSGWALWSTTALAPEKSPPMSIVRFHSSWPHLTT